MRLVLGDCVVELAGMAEASIDAIVTDPPYGLEFMGKDWDRLGDVRQPGDETFTDVDNPYGRSKVRYGGTSVYASTAEAGRRMQEWHGRWATEALRVLKPGGYLLAFGGSRTYHRLACALEDAGFDVRDSIAWLYGCLTADVEVLTEHGWRAGVDVKVGDRIAQWDDGDIALAPVERVFRAPWHGDLIRFRNHDVDQLVTPNHRVVHRHLERVQVAGERRGVWSSWKVAEAGDINRWQPVRLPVAGVHDGPGVGGDDYAALLGWVWAEGGFDPKGTGVRVYQSSVNADHVLEIGRLFDALAPGHKRYDRERVYKGRAYTESCWFVSGALARRIRSDLPGKHPTYELLWRMTASEKRALWAAAMRGDGSGAQFFQKDRADLVWGQTLLALIGQRGRVTMRSNRPGGSVVVTPRAETDLHARHLRVDREFYDGDVWCVSVPSGAFVARRNGHVFVTGNSGFPKNLDVGKAIDAHLGAERTEVVGVKPGHEDFVDRVDDHATGGRSAGWDRPWRDDHEAIARSHHRYAPATSQAAAWDGWGTALKPAFEPIVVARKPFKGTVAANVLAHGTGALNIDATRIAYASSDDAASAFPGGRVTSHAAGSLAGPGAAQDVERVEFSAQRGSGRWPTNVVLSHGPGCRQVGWREVTSNGHYPAERGPSIIYGSGNAGGMHGQDGLEARDTAGELVEEWECAPGCPVRVLDEQSGELRSGQPAVRRAPIEALEHNTYSGPESRQPGEQMVGYGDRGGASRFFPAFRYQAKPSSTERHAGVERNTHPTVKSVDLMRWLCRLVTRPGGTVVDPFMGSGTTGVACVLEGLDFVGIEREPEYLAIAEARIARAEEEESLALPIDWSTVRRRPEDVPDSQLDLFGP